MNTADIPTMTVAPPASVVDDATETWELFLSAFLSVDFWSSFLAILIAGLIITIYNHLFLKAERRHRIADSFCVNLEKLIIGYFNEDNKGKREVIAAEFFAYIRSFSLFVESNRSVANNPKIQNQWSILLNLEDESVNAQLKDKERMAQTLNAVAIIRYHLAK